MLENKSHTLARFKKKLQKIAIFSEKEPKKSKVSYNNVATNKQGFLTKQSQISMVF